MSLPSPSISGPQLPHPPSPLSATVLPPSAQRPQSPRKSPPSSLVCQSRWSNLALFCLQGGPTQRLLLPSGCMRPTSPCLQSMASVRPSPMRWETSVRYIPRPLSEPAGASFIQLSIALLCHPPSLSLLLLATPFPSPSLPVLLWVRCSSHVSHVLSAAVPPPSVLPWQPVPLPQSPSILPPFQRLSTSLPCHRIVLPGRPFLAPQHSSLRLGLLHFPFASRPTSTTSPSSLSASCFLPPSLPPQPRPRPRRQLRRSFACPVFLLLFSFP